MCEIDRFKSSPQRAPLRRRLPSNWTQNDELMVALEKKRKEGREWPPIDATDRRLCATATIRRLLPNSPDVDQSTLKRIPDVGERTVVSGTEYQVIEKTRSVAPRTSGN
jgi:hypothetical protein